MYLFDAADNSGSYTPKASIGTPGYATNGPPGSVADADHYNAMMMAIANTITDAGIALKTTGEANDDGQLLDAIGGAHAVKAHATDADGTTHKTRALVACQTSQATGNRSAVVASLNGLASGAQSSVVACWGHDDKTVSTPGGQAAAVACYAAGGATDAVTVDGAGNAALACYNSGGFVSQFTALTSGSMIAACQGTQVTGSAANAAIVASRALNNGATVTNQGTASLIAASRGDLNKNAIIAGGAIATVMLAVADADHDIGAATKACAMIACRGAEVTGSALASAVIASGHGTTTADRPSVDGNYSVVLGCTGQVSVTADNAVLIGSNFGDTGFTHSDDNCIAMYEGTAQRIRLDADGNAFLFNLPVFANEGAAGSLATGQLYQTGTGELRIKL